MYQEFQQNKKMSELSTYGIGGPARYFIEAKTIEKMQELLRFCQKEKLPFLIVGKGSNCLFNDKGFDGLVILNKIDFYVEEGDNIFYVGAGFSFSNLGIQTAKKGFSGLEFAAGIPASVGGAIFMNAGAQQGEAKDTLRSVDFVREDGVLSHFKKEELQFAYRTSPFQSMRGAIVAARFQLVPSQAAKTTQRALLDYRMKTQPYHEKSAGCVFRNPTGGSAGALIDKCGLKGFQVGGARVSEMHANFLVNSGAATASDMLQLIAEVQAKVKEMTGVELEREIRLLP